jgi:hypothetical protein
MELRDITNKTDKELEGGIQECFAIAYGTDLLDDKIIILAKADFFMRELEHRDEHRIARRDFWMEIGVIVLIGLEIALSLFGLYEQNKAFEKEQAFWTTMVDKSTLSVNVLKDLQNTTTAMNKGVQGQLDLNYVMAVDIQYEAVNYAGLKLTNNGRTFISYWGFKVGNDPAVFQRTPGNVQPTGSVYTASMENLLRVLRERTGQNSAFDYEVFLKDKNDIEYVATCSIYLSGEAPNWRVIISPTEVRQIRWSKKK